TPTVLFFQAGDGIRDRDVTGVQTCALPISVRTHTIITFNLRFSSRWSQAYPTISLENKLQHIRFRKIDSFDFSAANIKTFTRLVILHFVYMQSRNIRYPFIPERIHDQLDLFNTSFSFPLQG